MREATARAIEQTAHEDRRRKNREA
jgi:hypothetical protein